MTRRLYVFDLDGTLADTADLPRGRRMPHMLLDEDPMDEAHDPDRWAYINKENVRVASLPGGLESFGHRVAIITRSPRAYASTLCGLLGIESMLVWPSTDTDRAGKLRELARLGEVEIEDVVYVGDEEEDAQAAHEAGCDFEWAQHLGNEFHLAEDLPELGRSPRTVGEAARSLLENPQYEREEMQEFLANKARPEHRFCLIPADTTDRHSRGPFRYVGVRPALFLRDEHDETYFKFLRRLFPKLEAPEIHRDVSENYYFTSYTKYRSEQESEDPLGDLMRLIKDYRTASGQNVEFGSLRFVADVMAAHLSQRFARIELVNVDHVPPHPYSPDQPGQVSSWLCRWTAATAASHLGYPWMIWRSVERGEPGIRHRGRKPHEPGLSALLDDQRTMGTQLREQIEQSHLTYFLTMTWSFSQAERKTGPLPKHRRTRERCYWPDRGPCPRHGPSEFAIDQAF